MSTGSRNGHAILCACRGGRGPRGDIKRKRRHLRKLKSMKNNKQHHENDTGSRWVNTDVLSFSSPLFSLTYTDCRREEEKMRGAEVGGGGEKKRETREKMLRPGSCPSWALGSRTHQIRWTQRTFVCCSYAVVGRRGVVLEFIIKLPLQCCCFKHCRHGNCLYSLL